MLLFSRGQKIAKHSVVASERSERGDLIWGTMRERGLSVYFLIPLIPLNPPSSLVRGITLSDQNQLLG